VVLVVVFCGIVFFADAQTKWSYDYDNSGNRISRTIIMPMLTPPPQDSTETIIEDWEEDIVSGVQNSETGDEKSQEVYTDALSETQILIYPNPTTGLLTVKISDLPQHSASSLTLFDMQGRVIAQKQQLSNENKLDVSAQPAGTYIMQIAIGSEFTSWKIVKQ